VSPRVRSKISEICFADLAQIAKSIQLYDNKYINHILIECYA